MSVKTFTFGMSGIFAIFLITLSLASAITLSNPADLTLSDNSTSLTLTNNDGETENVQLSISNIVSGSNQIALSISPSQITNLLSTNSTSISISISSITGTFKFGDYSTTLRAIATNSSSGAVLSSKNVTVNFVKSFCKNGQAQRR